MKKNILSYSAPEVNIYEVVAERGYSVSTGPTLPGFGSEEDDLIYKCFAEPEGPAKSFSKSGHPLRCRSLGGLYLC